MHLVVRHVARAEKKERGFLNYVRSYFRVLETANPRLEESPLQPRPDHRYKRKLEVAKARKCLASRKTNADGSTDSLTPTKQRKGIKEPVLVYRHTTCGEKAKQSRKKEATTEWCKTFRINRKII